MSAPAPHREFGPVNARDHRLVGQLPPPELFVILFLGIAAFLMLVIRMG